MRVTLRLAVRREEGLKLASRSLSSAHNSIVLSWSLKLTKRPSHVSTWPQPKLLFLPSPCSPESWVREWQESRGRLAPRPLKPLSALEARQPRAQNLPQSPATRQAPSPHPLQWIAQACPASHHAPQHRAGLCHQRLATPPRLLLPSPPPLRFHLQRRFPLPLRRRETRTQQQAAARKMQVLATPCRTSSLTRRRQRG